MVAVFDDSLALKKRLPGTYLFPFLAYFRQHAVVLSRFMFYQNLWMPPSLPDCSPLDYYFWNKTKEKIRENKLNKPYENERKLKKRIESVWKNVAFNLPEIRKRRKRRKRRPMYQNDFWLRCIRTLILFFVQFQVFDVVSCNF